MHLPNDLPARACQAPSQANGSLVPAPCSTYSSSMAAPRETHGLRPRRSEAHIDTQCRDPLPGLGLCGLAALLHFPGPAQSRHLFCHAIKLMPALPLCRTGRSSRTSIAWGGLGRPSKRSDSDLMVGSTNQLHTACAKRVRKRARHPAEHLS